MFKGGHVPAAFSDVYMKYSDYIRLYLLCCNRENGTISVSPLEVLDWPYRFFITISMVQNEYIRFIQESHEKQMKNMKAKKPKRRGRV